VDHNRGLGLTLGLTEGSLLELLILVHCDWLSSALANGSFDKQVSWVIVRLTLGLTEGSLPELLILVIPGLSTLCLALFSKQHYSNGIKRFVSLFGNKQHYSNDAKSLFFFSFLKHIVEGQLGIIHL